MYREFQSKCLGWQVPFHAVFVFIFKVEIEILSFLCDAYACTNQVSLEPEAGLTYKIVVYIQHLYNVYELLSIYIVPT